MVISCHVHVLVKTTVVPLYNASGELRGILQHPGCMTCDSGDLNWDDRLQ